MPKTSRHFDITPLYVDRALESMIIPGVGIQASNFQNFKDDFFGRDSLRVARDLPGRQDIGKIVIQSLARLQAREEQVANPMADATFGGIHHEARLLYVNGRKIGPIQQEHLQRWTKNFGGDENGFIYYGATDTTPDYVTFIAEYCRRYGGDWLDDSFEHASGKTYTYRQSLLDALRWIEERQDMSKLHLVESYRRNPTGHYFQFWRDTHESYRFPDGRIINANGPIASFEVQLKAYDALVSGAELLGHDLPDKAKEWKDRSENIRQQILERFWMPDQQFFGMAIDHDPRSGEPRLVSTITTLPSEALNSKMWLNLTPADQEKYCGSIIRQTFSSKLLTDVGLRCMSTDMFAVLNHQFNHGPSGVWPMLTNVVAIGLRDLGCFTLADELEQRILNGVNIAAKLMEIFDVDQQGRVDYDPLQEYPLRVEREERISHIRPEHIQAWTCSAVKRVINVRQHPLPADTLGWQKHITDEIMQSLSPAPHYHTVEDLEDAFPKDYGFTINRDEAIRRLNQDLKDNGFDIHFDLPKMVA